MSAPSPSGYEQNNYPRRTSTHDRRLDLAHVGTRFVRGETWTEGTYSRQREPQINYATLSAAHTAGYTEAVTDHGSSGNTSMLRETYAYPMDTQLDDVAGTSAMYPAKTFHRTGPGRFFEGQVPTTQEQISELTPAEFTSAEPHGFDQSQPEPMNNDGFQQWAQTPVSGRFNDLTSAGYYKTKNNDGYQRWASTAIGDRFNDIAEHAGSYQSETMYDEGFHQSALLAVGDRSVDSTNSQNNKPKSRRHKSAHGPIVGSSGHFESPVSASR